MSRGPRWLSQGIEIREKGLCPLEMAEEDMVSGRAHLQGSERRLWGEDHGAGSAEASLSNRRPWCWPA